MTWAETRGQSTAAKYRTKEHRDLRAHYVDLIRTGEHVECTAVTCVLESRRISETDGRIPAGLTLGHHDDGIRYRGPEHRACNLHDAAVRARAKQSTTKAWVV